MKNSKTPCCNYAVMYSLTVISPILTYLLGWVLIWLGFRLDHSPEFAALVIFLIFFLLTFFGKMKDAGYIN